MKKLIFKYKRWYCRLIIIANLLIPFFIFISCGKYIKGMNATITNDITGGLVLATIATATFIGFGLSYIFQTFKTDNFIREYLAVDKNYYKRLFIGILLYSISMFIMLLIVTGKYFAKSASWFEYIIFVFAGITCILGVISNIHIHQFEATNYFKIFYYRHKNEDVKEILDDLIASKRRRKTSKTNR